MNYHPDLIPLIENAATLPEVYEHFRQKHRMSEGEVNSLLQTKIHFPWNRILQ